MKNIYLFSGSESRDAFWLYHCVEKQDSYVHVSAQKGVKHEHLQVKKAFQCTHTMGMLVPSLHRESTDSLYTYFVPAIVLIQ